VSKPWQGVENPS